MQISRVLGPRDVAACETFFCRRRFSRRRKILRPIDRVEAVEPPLRSQRITEEEVMLRRRSASVGAVMPELLACHEFTAWLLGEREHRLTAWDEGGE